MIAFICHSTHRCRAWLIALAALLLVVSILEAAHVHGVFAAEDDHCALCQHPIALDKILQASLAVIPPLLLSILAGISCSGFTPRISRHFALIRAPPQQLQHP